MLVSRRFVVGGRVQGVGFRYFTEEAALREGLSGYDRNRDDGTVEAEVEGDAESVERFELAIRRGPRATRVESFSYPMKGIESIFHRDDRFSLYQF